jgi:hypothetical protein
MVFKFKPALGKEKVCIICPLVSWPAFITIFRITSGLRNSFESFTSGYRKAGTSFLKRASGRIFNLVRYFRETSRNLILNDFQKQTAKNCETH